jgi:hypothetical protein
LVILLSPPLFGQTAPSGLIPGSDNRQLQEKETIAAMVSVQKYCWTAESFSESHEPRLFAETHSGANQIAEWVELSNRAEWLRVGKPKPIAWVWYKDGSVIQVAMAFDKRDEKVRCMQTTAIRKTASWPGSHQSPPCKPVAMTLISAVSLPSAQNSCTYRTGRKCP